MQFLTLFINFLAFHACVLAAPRMERRGQYSAISLASFFFSLFHFSGESPDLSSSDPSQYSQLALCTRYSFPGFDEWIQGCRRACHRYGQQVECHNVNKYSMVYNLNKRRCNQVLRIPNEDRQR